MCTVRTEALLNPTVAPDRGTGGPPGCRGHDLGFRQAWASLAGLIGGPALLSSILVLSPRAGQPPSLHLSQLIKRFQEKQTHETSLLWSVQEQ